MLYHPKNHLSRQQAVLNQQQQPEHGEGWGDKLIYSWNCTSTRYVGPFLSFPSLTFFPLPFSSLLFSSLLSFPSHPAFPFLCFPSFLFPFLISSLLFPSLPFSSLSLYLSFPSFPFLIVCLSSLSLTKVSSLRFDFSSSSIQKTQSKHHDWCFLLKKWKYETD